MRREQAVALLSAHLDEIRVYAVRRLALIGSVARDEAGVGSDVDVFVEFDGPAMFERYTGLLAFLEDLFGGRVDLLTPRSIKPRVAERIQQEMVRIA